MRVDAALRAWVGGGALVYVDACLPVVFQAEAGVASALREGAAGELFRRLLATRWNADFLFFVYLEAYFQVLAELRAAAQFSVQTFVNEAVQLIGAVAAVVLAVAEQRLVHAVAVAAGVRGVVAFVRWGMAEKASQSEHSQR